MLEDVASIITALAALGAVAVSIWNSRKIQAVHVDINSRMDQLLKVSTSEARVSGIAQGRKDANDEASRK